MLITISYCVCKQVENCLEIDNKDLRNNVLTILIDFTWVLVLFAIEYNS